MADRPYQCIRRASLQLADLGACHLRKFMAAQGKGDSMCLGCLGAEEIRPPVYEEQTARLPARPHVRVKVRDDAPPPPSAVPQPAPTPPAAIPAPAAQTRNRPAKPAPRPAQPKPEGEPRPAAPRANRPQAGPRIDRRALRAGLAALVADRALALEDALESGKPAVVLATVDYVLDPARLWRGVRPRRRPKPLMKRSVAPRRRTPPEKVK